MSFEVGEKVSLLSPIRYLKTAGKTSFLRPPDLVPMDESGVVVSIHSSDQVEVMFRQGNYLIPSNCLKSN